MLLGRKLRGWKEGHIATRRGERQFVNGVEEMKTELRGERNQCLKISFEPLDPAMSDAITAGSVK